MNNILVISCGIFEKEVQSLKLPFDFIFIDSMLHIYPARLKEKMQQLIDQYTDRNIILLYGDCHSRIIDYTNENPNIVKVDGINCCEIILGKEQYKKLRHEQVFFFLPEWALRWREIFENELKMSEKNAKLLMKDMHSRFVYIDTGVSPVPYETIEEIADFFSMETEIFPAGCEHIKQGIINAAGLYD